MWGWFWVVGILIAIIGCYLYARRRPQKLLPEGRYVVTFDERRIAVADPSGGLGEVPWDQMIRVGIRTTDEGPFLPDVFPSFAPRLNERHP
jgi:hypothetical protein